MEDLKTVISSYLSDKEDLFLVDIQLKQGSFLRVVIDGDKGVKISDCVALNRFLETYTEQDDYAIEVTSFGVGSPLKLRRQYKKNVGKQVKTLTNGGNIFEGTLSEVNDVGIELSYKKRVPKIKGKGKMSILEKVRINWEEIDKTNIEVVF